MPRSTPDTGYTLTEIAQRFELTLDGQGSDTVHRIAPLDTQDPQAISFIVGTAYLDQLASCQAAAVILPPALAPHFSGNKLYSETPYYHYACLSQWFEPSLAHSGVHPSAVVSETATLDPSVCVGANVVIEAGATLASGVSVGAGSFIGPEVSLGADTRIDSNVSIYARCVLGERCTVLANAVIGSDGFGFAPKPGGGWQRIAQLGRVLIGDEVTVGASTTIDRGALEDTLIGDGVILDNQIQIGHNVRIGRYTAIAGCVGVAGSAVIGENCAIAGAAGVLGHLEISDGVQVMAHSLVRNSVKEAGVYASGTPLQPIGPWRKNSVRFKQLDELAKRVTQLEREHKTRSS